jgi:anaerobic magnesium-protoporphyrin IX monomethyl ester cyclase
MPDILLVQPPIRDFYLTAKRTIPYGLACVAAALISKGFSVEILDGLASARSRPLPLPAELRHLHTFYGRPDASPFALFHRFRHFGYSFEHLARRARECGAPLVGISALCTPYAAEALAVAAAIKALHPAGTIVMGGHHATVLPESLLESPAVDFVLRGEGEVSLPLLARCLRDGGDVGGIPGIGFRRPDGSLCIRPPAVMQRLEDYPPPAMELLDLSFYRRGGRGSTVITAGRGCPFACSYCSVGRESWMPYRLRPVADVIAELEDAVTGQGAAFIDFEDENLSLDRAWFAELLGRLHARFTGTGIELRAMNGMFPPTLDAEIVGAMRQAGFKTLNLALAATHPDQLRRFKRPDVRRDFDRALSLAESHGMNAVGYIIVGAPHQDPEASVDDLLFLAARRVLAGVSVYYPAPGSSDYTLCRDLGLLPGHFGAMRASALPIEHATRRVDSATLLRLGRVVNFMKHLLDRGLPIPAPAHAHTAGLDPADRIETGRRLLARFLADGGIRGITPDGEVYDHLISPHLTRRFLTGLHRITMRGTTRCPPNPFGKERRGIS